jgi:hypothetical protein
MAARPSRQLNDVPYQQLREQQLHVEWRQRADLAERLEVVQPVDAGDDEPLLRRQPEPGELLHRARQDRKVGEPHRRLVDLTLDRILDLTRGGSGFPVLGLERARRARV